ncbi:unnamed protein product [Symbiodinium natans]|uniref:Uncharacterized protein n=1 Tax=Symbiodinium natans TaxID=878477 RepID=A0A812MHF0_9DINO|nr:unnamed protein product [Symbiodinium natans]
MRESLRRAATSHLALLSPEEAVEEALPVLVLAAEAIADCLSFGKPLRRTRAAAIQEVFLQESPDESDEAAARCKAIREAFADEVHKAVLTSPSAVVARHVEECTSGFKQPVRVEVRGTAGRALTDRAFAVGAKGECDVQVLGDLGVLPLQFLVIKLPFCSVIADFWSDCATRVTWRMSAKDPGTPLLPGEQGSCYVIANDERVVLHIGAHSTVALGPSAHQIQKVRKKAARTFEEAFSSLDCVQVVSKCKRRSSSASTSCGSLVDDSGDKPDSSVFVVSRSISPARSVDGVVIL